MSNTYIEPKYSKIGDYKISDSLFDASLLNTTIDDFNEKITNNINDIISLYVSAEYAVTSVDNLKLSVDDLYISANYIPSLVYDIKNALDRLDGHDGDLNYLSGVLSTLNLKALRHAIADVGILKPGEAHELYLKVTVFDAKEMTTSLGTIDMRSQADWNYFKVLLVNNGENSVDSALDPLRSEYFPGTQWVTPNQIDEAVKKYSGSGSSFAGYGPAFNNSPVNISFLAWLDDHDFAGDLDSTSRFFLRYQWYYIDSDEVHESDHYSMMVPSYAEVGAKAGSSISKSEFQEIKQALETQIATAHYIDEDEIEEITSEIDPDNPRYGLVEYSNPGFYVEPYQCTILEAFGTCNDKNIVLQNYSEGKTYKLKFKTGSSNISVGSSASATKVAFKVNFGNGPETLDDLASSRVVFQANTTYLIAVNLGMIQVIAQN